jgi:CDP-paratose 2-epimerase
MEKILITGGCGFLGSNLCYHGLKNGYQISVIDNLSRRGSKANLNWLVDAGLDNYHLVDISNQNEIEKIIKELKPDFIFHLAAQVAMINSIKDPYEDFQTNALGTMVILEAVRNFSPKTGIIFASTNKVYGDLKKYRIIESKKRYELLDSPNGFDEETKIDFQSPYGCSKGSADQYMQDYYRMYNVNSIVFRHSTLYGGRQHSTFEQGWISWFCSQAIKQKFNNRTEPFTISGDGKQVRDILHINDAISLYFLAIKNMDKLSGNVYNIGGGKDNSISIIELINLLEEEFNHALHYSFLPWRSSDQKVFISDVKKIQDQINWKVNIKNFDGIKMMIDWLLKQ